MIDLHKDALMFSFPEVHPEAKLSIDFQRTLRIPDDGKDYPLPPGLGRFPTRLVDDFPDGVPQDWLDHGGVLLPMYQSEAMWLDFNAARLRTHAATYPFAIKIAAGKINAVTGEAWDNKLHRDPQDYLTVPRQPWLDGFSIEKGVIRQFVAMPLGAGYTAEEQITGEAEFGGLQIIVYPMKREVFERRFPEVFAPEECSIGSSPAIRGISFLADAASPDMGLAPGGRMRQEIFEDPFSFDDWDRQNASRCYVHLANSLVWRAITGSHPPTTPPTAKHYSDAGLPWFEYYDDRGAPLAGSDRLRSLKSVLTLGKKKGDVPLPENESVSPKNIVELRRGLRPGQVREEKAW